MKFNLRLILILSFTSVLLFPNILSSAPGAPGGGEADVPIDGGIFTVVGAAAAYGAYKLRKEKGEKSDENID